MMISNLLFTLFCKEKLRRDTGVLDAVVLALILYSDSTLVTNNGRDSVWPVYMTLANIPMHRRKQPGCFQLLGFIPQIEGNFYFST